MTPRMTEVWELWRDGKFLATGVVPLYQSALYYLEHTDLQEGDISYEDGTFRVFIRKEAFRPPLRGSDTTWKWLPDEKAVLLLPLHGT